VRISYIVILFSLAFTQQPAQVVDFEADPRDSIKQDTTFTEHAVKTMTALEYSMLACQLVDVQLLHPAIQVDLKYSSESNFLGQNIYGQLHKAYLEETTAKKLAIAQIILTGKYSGLSLLVWDAARPVSCQQKMWDALQMPAEQKGRFVSNPKNYSLHNYGCAVDVTLIDSSGLELDMGTIFDQFDSLAQPKYETHLILLKRLSPDQISNRQILRNVMYEAGFTGIGSEWWHFNSCSRLFAKLNYPLIF
jgi:zinc D-Ala-D-Ala dipeptidase